MAFSECEKVGKGYEQFIVAVLGIQRGADVGVFVYVRKKEI